MNQWPGNLFRCRHLERQYMDLDKIGADGTDYATKG